MKPLGRDEVSGETSGMSSSKVTDFLYSAGVSASSIGP